MKAMSLEEIKINCTRFAGWSYNEQTEHLEKTFEFKTYYPGLVFLNAVAWQAQQLKHHPDLKLSYGKCHVQMQTHDVGGISEKDFELIAKIEELV